MDIRQFRASTDTTKPPGNLSQALQALWWDAKGEWRKAHEHAQAQDDKAGAWVHAYLHRKEGNRSNAGYWYRRCGKAASTAPLEQEWDAIARALLQTG
ncbi:MAG: hypothetical protein ACREIB_11905 [Pseudomonadota bacterium]